MDLPIPEWVLGHLVSLLVVLVFKDLCFSCDVAPNASQRLLLFNRRQSVSKLEEKLAIRK